MRCTCDFLRHRRAQFEWLEPRRVLDSATFIKGDFDRDGALTDADIPAMCQALIDLKSYQANHALSDSEILAIGDADNSGSVSNLDLQAVIDLVITAQSSLPDPTRPPPDPTPTPVANWFDGNLHDAVLRSWAASIIRTG